MSVCPRCPARARPVSGGGTGAARAADLLDAARDTEADRVADSHGDVAGTVNVERILDTSTHAPVRFLCESHVVVGCHQRRHRRIRDRGGGKGRGCVRDRSVAGGSGCRRYRGRREIGHGGFGGHGRGRGVTDVEEDFAIAPIAWVVYALGTDAECGGSSEGELGGKPRPAVRAPIEH